MAAIDSPSADNRNKSRGNRLWAKVFALLHGNHEGEAGGGILTGEVFGVAVGVGVDDESLHDVKGKAFGWVP
jgi:hypothetical protein